MPVLTSGTLISPLYDTASLENAKFTVTNGTVASNVNLVGGASGYAELGTAGTITGNAIVFRSTGGTLRAVGTAYPLPVQEAFAPGYEDNTNSVAGMILKPVSSSTYAPTEYTSFGAATGAAVKTSAGNLFSLHVTSGTAAIRYFQLFNGTAAPALGGTPVASYPMGSVPVGGIAELKLDTGHFSPSRYFSTGIAWAMSSTNGTLGTASVTAGDVNVHIKYV